MILAILQARVSSSRFPAKVLQPILGVPMLARQIERIQRISRSDRLIVATSSEGSDDPIQQLCLDLGVTCYRGELNDVLDRFYQAARLGSPSAEPPDHILRLTGDCPLLDPELIDQLISFYLAADYDYVSNTLELTFPDGLDAEIFKFNCLEAAWQEAKLPSEREHVSLFIHQQPSRYKLGSFKSNIDYSDLRWTVDEPVDLELVTKIYEALYPKDPAFKTEDILNFLAAHPALKKLNQAHERNQGYQQSLVNDRLYLKKLDE
jgi:spore coat polysaccharide biosynthesis protein SpsF